MRYLITLLFAAIFCFSSLNLVGQTFNLNSEAPVQAQSAVFWSHDCNIDACADWSFDNGAYEVGAPWEEIDINFECTTDGPAGPYNQWAGGSGDGSAASAMNSTTSANGLIIVDSDLFGADANYDTNWVENCWFSTVTPVNCSDHPYVSISLETRYRCWDNGSSDDSEKCLIEISRDGVSWPAIDSWDEESGTVVYGTDSVASRKEVFPGYGTGDSSDNPSFLEFDITESAGGQETVYIRFRWSGTWGYSWEIDDIKVYDTPANDTRIDNYLSYTDFERTGYYEYGAWPLSQIPTDLAAAAKVYNVGYEDQTNVTLDVTAVGTTASSSAISLAYATADTLSAAYLPTALGPVTVEYSLNADAADENPENNMASQSFEVTDLSWGRDDGVTTAAAPGDGTDDYIAMSLFDIVEDVVIYAIDVAIMDGSESGTSLIAHLFDLFDESALTEQYGGLLQSTDEFDLIEGNTNAVGEVVTTWYTFVFDEPYMASAGDRIGAGFEHYGGSNVQYGESKFTQDGTAFIYGPFGAGSAYDWYYTNEVPMVRLNLNPNAVNTYTCLIDGIQLEIDALGVCGGSCSADTDADGVCDDEDDCVGAYDECGICNGDGFSCVQTCLDDDGALSAVGGCFNAVDLLGCSFYWDDILISELCPESCDNCPCDNDFNDNGVCDDVEVFSCTYLDAVNYNSSATADDGSCVFETTNACPADLDDSGVVATQDLLIFLSLFGEICE